MTEALVFVCGVVVGFIIGVFATRPPRRPKHTDASGNDVDS